MGRPKLDIDATEVYKLAKLSLQPLWKAENLKKGNRV